MQNLCRTIAILLMGLLPGSPSLPVAAVPSFSPSSAAADVRHKIPSKTNQTSRAVHILNRLAFGPSPGEMNAIESMGVDRWMYLQLHPEEMDDSLLEQRLAGYKAPFMNPQTLMMQFPLVT